MHDLPRNIRAVGLDFGTTNSVLSLVHADGHISTFEFRHHSVRTKTYRSVLCYWKDEVKGRSALNHAAGPRAIETYEIEGRYARLLMSLKSYLASDSFQKARIFAQSISLEALIATLLSDLLSDAGLDPHSFQGPVFAGRPVNFSMNADLNGYAEQRLKLAFEIAGISSPQFILEPEAALHTFVKEIKQDETSLVADLGGGTSDFSVVRILGASSQEIVPMSSSGIAIAGDTFDYRIIDNAITPLLGKGTLYRPLEQYLPVPLHYYNDFARWHALALMNTYNTINELKQIQRTSTRSDAIANLIQFIEAERGLALYRLVSEAKADLSVANEVVLNLQPVGIKYSISVSRAEFETWIADDLRKICDCAGQAVELARVPKGDIATIFLTGGSSLIPAVKKALAREFPNARFVGGNEFQSVSEGLAILARDSLASL